MCFNPLFLFLAQDICFIPVEFNSSFVPELFYARCIRGGGTQYKKSCTCETSHDTSYGFTQLNRAYKEKFVLIFPNISEKLVRQSENVVLEISFIYLLTNERRANLYVVEAFMRWKSFCIYLYMYV